MHRDKIRKAKAQLELNLQRHVKNKKKGFYSYIGRRRQAKDSVPHLISKDGELASTDMEKDEIVSSVFPQSSLVVRLPVFDRNPNL